MTFFQDKYTLKQFTEVPLKLQDKPEKRCGEEGDTCSASEPNKKVSKEQCVSYIVHVGE